MEHRLLASNRELNRTLLSRFTAVQSHEALLESCNLVINVIIIVNTYIQMKAIERFSHDEISLENFPGLSTFLTLSFHNTSTSTSTSSVCQIDRIAQGSSPISRL